MKLFNFNTLILIIALLMFLGLYEIYPRPGWVDSSMYVGYAINPAIYKVFSFSAHNYQGSRLGYILPFQLLLSIFGYINGRTVYVFILYFSYVLSVITLARFFIIQEVERMLVCILFIANPIFTSSIFYGGADGPAAVQLIVAALFLVYAARVKKQFNKEFFSFLSGSFVALSVSSHIFALIPTILLIPALLYVLKSGRFIYSITLGGVATICICNFYGYQLGLDKFYLLYSLPWARASLGGIGTNFAEPFSNKIQYLIFWCPVLLSTPFFFFIRRKLLSSKDKLHSLWVASWLNLIGPFTIYLLFDRFTGGNTLVTPAYFNIVYPSFIVGLILMVSLNLETTSDSFTTGLAGLSPLRLILLTLVCVSLSITFLSSHSKSTLTYNSGESKDFYRSEVSFVDRFKLSGLNAVKLQFIYEAKGPEGENDSRVYKDFHKGSRRYFDYLDSLTGLFLWDRSIALRLQPNTDLKELKFRLKETNAPVIFLGRSKAEVHKLFFALSKFLVGYTSSNVQCYEDKNYPWCFVAYSIIQNPI
jgi:hypothetical protein